jgi:energy-coupling factor transporter ATP-binding protein EcfA2
MLLLDEPETSLHPGAQRELLKFILEQIWEKHLQVVISTHAPSLVRDLSREAIKVMRQQLDGMIVIEQGLSAEEAFYEIGQPFEPSCNVIVEDRLTKRILEEVAKSKSGGFAARLRIEYRPGGDSEMKKDIAVFMHGGHRPVFVFDGDKKPAGPHIDPTELPVNQQTDLHLDEIIKKQTGVNIKFQQDSGMSPEKKGALRADYLNYCLHRVLYLPFSSPEEGVWDDIVAEGLLKTILVEESKVAAVMTAIGAEADFKKKFKILTDELGQGAAHPSTFHAMFVTHFIQAGGPNYRAASALLETVVAAAEARNA